MIQTPVLPESLAGDATFAILSAGQAPGPSVAKRAAKMGAEVVVLDRDPSVLADLMSQSAERVGGLALSGGLVRRFEPLHRNWGTTPGAAFSPDHRARRAGRTGRRHRALPWV